MGRLENGPTSVNVAGFQRETILVEGNLWVDPVKESQRPRLIEGGLIDIPGPDGITYDAKLYNSPLTGLSPFHPPDIRIVRLGDLVRHENHDKSRFGGVVTTQYWQDKPLFVGQIGKDLILLDGATRRGKIDKLYGSDQLVPIQVVNFLSPDLLLYTWLEPVQEYLLAKLRVPQIVNEGKLVLPRQTRFGVHLKNGLVVSVAETQPTIEFNELFLRANYSIQPYNPYLMAPPLKR